MTGSPEIRAPMRSCCVDSAMVRTEPECRARRKVEMARAAPFPSGAPGLHGAIVIITGMTLLPNPPLTAGSLLATIFFEDVACIDCTAAMSPSVIQYKRETCDNDAAIAWPAGPFPLVGRDDISLGADALACARRPRGSKPAAWPPRSGSA